MEDAAKVRSAQKAFYDGHYEHGYMQDFANLWEACRVLTLRQTFAALTGLAPQRVLDYGCGEGRYLGVLRDCFPRAHVVGGDISEVALEHAARRHPDAEWVLMDDERFPNSTVPSI